MREKERGVEGKRKGALFKEERREERRKEELSREKEGGKKVRASCVVDMWDPLVNLTIHISVDELSTIYSKLDI